MAKAKSDGKAAVSSARGDKSDSPARNTVKNRTAKDKAAILEALKESKGIISKACEAVGIARKTFYEWKNSDSDFASACEEVTEVTLDVLESVVLNIAMAGQQERDQLNAAQFLLRSKGKHRGFSDKIETQISGELKTQNTIEVVRAEFPNNGTEDHPPLPPSWSANTSGILPG